MREVINPKTVHWPFGFSHIVKVGDTVYISGQLPQDQDGNIVGKTNAGAAGMLNH